MSQEDYPVEFVLDSMGAVMAPAKHPKVLLFDIGGVCARKTMPRYRRTPQFQDHAWTQSISSVTGGSVLGDEGGLIWKLAFEDMLKKVEALQVVSPFQAILDYELSKNIPPGWVNYSISKTKPNGFWHRLERGEILMDKDWFAGFTADLHNQKRWTDFYFAARSKNPRLPKETPPLPDIDGEYLFWKMMGGSRAADPWMFPALKKLKESGKYILAALSNTVIFPPDHPYSNTHNEVKAIFDVFISSAHVGMRKPNADIYQYTVNEINKWAKLNARSGRGWEEGVKPNEIMFMDDIGENLKAGKKAGFGTIKVDLGRAYEAVDALEELTGLQLAGDHPRIAAKPKL